MALEKIKTKHFIFTILKNIVQIFNLTLIALEKPHGETILNTEQPNG